MDIDYKTKKLEKIFRSKSQLERMYGTAVGKKIQIRINTLRASKNLKDLWPPYCLPERCHELKGGRAGEFSINLTGNDRLLFIPNHTPLPRHETDGRIDWSNITKIKIIGVGDETHG